MWDKIKDSAGWIVGAIGAVIGFLVYFLTLKNRQIDGLKAKIDLADTQKQADMIELEVKQYKEQNAKLDKEHTELDKTLVALDAKREELKKQSENMTTKQVEDYWNKP